ncbi:hypothetical protein SRABI128_05236 [Microbacterium sp. Bi128]|nr:hypothetical protein SRABI128_05236 [Microbacterium sp. Bi128]
MGGVGDVGQVGVFHQPVGDVDAEPVHAAIQPEPQYAFEHVPYVGVGPVEVGLGGVEDVQVPLPEGAVGFGDACPHRPAEYGLPIVGRELAVLAFAFAEDVTGAGGAAGG